MPELPEVETVLRGLNERVVGRRVTVVKVLSPLVIVGSPAEFVKAVVGRSIESVVRKGKALALELGAGNGEAPRYLIIRLGMTGQFVVGPKGNPLLPHTHVRLILEDGAHEIRYRDVRRFGRLRCCTREELDSIFARLGPDAREMTEQDFSRALNGRRGAIKSWLINQQFLSGLGNIYADEALFEARVHPLAQAGRLPLVSIRRLHRAVKKVLDRAIASGGTSVRDYLNAMGRPGGYRKKLRVYQRTGEPCYRCKKPIRRLTVAGRSSHFCPRCQPRPRHVATGRNPTRLLPR